VIDFGLAKAINQPLTDATLYTGFSRMMGTPMYMSPEQAEMGVIDVDTRCDVYALGVMLYELLTGDPPFCREAFKSASFDEMRRLIREVEPKRPSFAVSTLVAERQTTIADQRHIDPRKLRDSLHGELDWIVMKALEKDRSRRYESASDLAADIERYLRNERVEACPPSTAYAVRKFANRNRGLVTAASVVGLLILIAAGLLWNERSRTLAALGGETTQREEAEKNLRLAMHQQAAAEANLMTAIDAVEQMLARVGISSLKDMPQLTSVRAELLKDADRFFETLLERDPTNPEIRFQRAQAQIQFAELGTRTGWERSGLSLSPVNAIATLEELVSEFPDILRYKESLANAWLTRASQSRKTWMHVSHEEALVLCRNAIGICEELYTTDTQNDSYRVQLANCYVRLADTLFDMQRYAESEEQARYAIESLGYENASPSGCGEKSCDGCQGKRN
jgi:tetratricopeptide (TPR) repeat protein